MLYRKNLHVHITAAIFLALGGEVTVVSPSEMEKGEIRALMGQSVA